MKFQKLFAIFLATEMILNKILLVLGVLCVWSNSIAVIAAPMLGEFKESQLDIDAPNSFRLEKISIDGNTILSEEIERVTSPYLGKRVNFSELYAIKEAITKLYVKAGYVNSGAYLPPQRIENGIVKFYIIEGEIGEVNISGLNRLSSGYIEARLGSNKPPFNASSFLDRLYQLKQDPLIDSVSAELAAGVDPGKSVLEVEIVESKAFSFELGINNQSSPATGVLAGTAKIAHGNLLGFGDAVRLNYLQSEGSMGVDTAYSVPLGNRIKIDLGYGISDNKIVEDVFTALDIESASNFWSTGVAGDIYQSSKLTIDLGVNFTHQHSETTLLGSPFAIALGADEDGNTDVSALRFSQSLTKRGEDSILALRSQFSFGVDAFDATIAEDEATPDGEFFAWRGQGQYVKNLADNFPLIFKGDLQLTSDRLVSLEQFRVGGVNSVRGYRKNIALADSGFLLSSEARIPVFKAKSIDGLLQIAPFVDYGMVWNTDDVELGIDSILSAGIGFSASAFNDRLNGRLDISLPLIDVKPDNYPLTFNLEYKF